MLLKHGLYIKQMSDGCLFERKVLQCIFGGKQENGAWRKRYNYEVYEIFNEPTLLIISKLKD
jgi:hypothetical protein